MATVYCIGHLGYLLVLPAAGNPNGGSVGLAVYLVFLVQFNDVTQYLSGKLLGRRKVVPSVSPNKTWEGLLCGLLVTVVLATLLAPWLTPLDGMEAFAAGLLIGLSGFAGDLVISAIKRDLGVKDTGTMLAGHGGILDRVDMRAGHDRRAVFQPRARARQVADPVDGDGKAQRLHPGDDQVAPGLVLVRER